MVNWPRHSSSPRAHRTDRRWPIVLPVLVLLTVGCGRADDRPGPGDVQGDPVPDAPPRQVATGTTADDALCVPAASGSLRARLQGAIDAEIDWGADARHCLGGVRPQGDGLRLVYKGSVAGIGPLLLVFGLAPLRPGESARNVPANLTVVREGTGQFFATQGEDKCALDSVTQVPMPGEASVYLLEGRGYCTQPARALGDDGSVLVSRFDVVAVVPAAAAPGTSATPRP